MAVYQKTTPREDTVTKRPLTQDDIRFLTALQHEMNTQDTMCNADPRFWVIKGVRWNPCEDSDAADVTILNGPGSETVASTTEEAVQFLFSDDIAECLAGTNYSIENAVPDPAAKDTAAVIVTVKQTPHDIKRVFNIKSVKDVYEVLCFCRLYDYTLAYETMDPHIYPDTLFLTHKACEDHLRQYHYNYDEKAHAYAMTAIRSPEVEALWKLIQQVDFAALLPSEKQSGTTQQVCDDIMRILKTERGIIDGLKPGPGENKTAGDTRALHFSLEHHTIRRLIADYFREKGCVVDGA